MAFQETVLSAIRTGLAEKSLTAHAAARAAGLPARSYQSLLEGRSPSLNRLGELCRALDLELYIGPARDGPSRAELPPNTNGHRWGDRRGKEVTPYPVPKRGELQKVKTGFSPHGCAYFGLDFLLDFDLNPKLCEVVEISDNSMAPEFPAGSAGLVDLRRTERVEGRVYALGTPNLTVRRARKTPSCWSAVPDNPEHATVPWRDDFEIVGQVVWTSHMVDVQLAVPASDTTPASPA